MKKPMPGKYLSFDGVLILAETDLALLVNFGVEEVWIPKSQIHEDSFADQEGLFGEIIISEWIVRKNDLAEEGVPYKEGK